MGTMKGQVLSSITKLCDLVLLILSFTIATLPHIGASGSVSLVQFLHSGLPPSCSTSSG
jgi:hypothetical protein